MIILPLCDEQQYIFNVNEAIASIPMKISYSMKFSKRFSLEELSFAIHKCIDTADVFGARCVVKENRTYMEFYPYEHQDIPVFVFSTEEEYELFYKRDKKAKINNRDKLYNLFIYSIADSYFHIHFTFNHLIFDANSVLLLCDQIQKVLLHKEVEVKWYPFSAHLDKIKIYNKSEKYLIDKEFWENRFLEFSKSEYLFKDVIDQDEAPIKESTFQTSKQFKKELVEYCGIHNISLQFLIVTVLTHIINNKTGCNRFYFDITVGNRLGKNEKNSLGVYELGYSYVFDFARYHHMVDLYKSVHEQSVGYYKHKNFDWITKTFSKSYEEKYGRFIPQICFSYFCTNKKPSFSIATLDYHKNETDMLPMTLLISDYTDWESMTFHYIYWESYFTEEEVEEIHKDIESTLADLMKRERFW